jgi:hypothetical protein
MAKERNQHQWGYVGFVHDTGHEECRQRLRLPGDCDQLRAAATPNPAIVGDNIAFTVTASDPDGDALTYSWSFGDSFTGAGSTVNHAYSAAGAYTAVVTVSDGFGGSATSSISVTVNPGPVGYWKLDDGSGTSATDSSGNGNTGMLVNGPTWVTGKINGALQFNGTNQYVTVPAPTGSSIDLDKVPVTLAAWINPAIVNKQQAILLRGMSDGIGRGHQGYGMWINSNGTINVGSAGGGNFSSNVAVAANAWSQVTGVINGTASKVYINGVDRTPSSVNIGIVASSLPLTLGASRDGTNSGYVVFFNGVLDDVRVYNRALSAAEAAALANMTMAPAVLSADSAAFSVPNQPLNVTRMQASVTFSGPHRGGCSISGTIPGTAQEFKPAGQTFSVNIMGAAASFTLDAKGRGKSPHGSVTVKPGKSANGEALVFSVKLTNAGWAVWGLEPDSKKETWTMDMWASVVLGGTEYSTPMSVDYSPSSKGAKLKAGTAP